MSISEFNNAVLALKNPLKFFALNLTHNDDDAQDLVQDTFVKAIVYREKYTDATNLKAWMYTIMKNTFINNYRRSKKNMAIIDTTADLHYVNIAQKNGVNASESDIVYKDINKAIDSLSDEYKVPFLRHFEGYKYQEISDELNLPIGTVKSRIFFARKQLTELLKDFR